MQDRGYDRGGRRGRGRGRFHHQGQQQYGRGRDHQGQGRNYHHQNQQQQPEQQYQRSYVGKRGREEEAPKPTAQHILVAKMLGLCDRNTGSPKDKWDDERFFEDLLKSCRKDLEYGGEHVLNLLVEAAVEVSFKTQHYALVLGLLNVERSDFSRRVVVRVRTEAEAALASGQNFRFKQLLRFMSCMARVRVVPSSWLLEQLGRVVTTAKAGAAAAAGADPTGITWQPWTDFLVATVLQALPWCGAYLAGQEAEGLTALLSDIQAYMDCRPMQVDECLRPMRGARGQDDMAAGSDSGGASFLGILWDALQACEKHGWAVITLASPADAFSEKLEPKEPKQPVEPLPNLDPLTVPQQPTGVDASLSRPEVAARVRAAYPPRGGIRLLGSKYLEGVHPVLERLIIEDYVLDTLTTLSSDRTVCVLTLSQTLPHHLEHIFNADENNVRNIVAEVLFGQMLALPRPRLNFAAYCTILVDLCKIPAFQFARALSSCVRELFACTPFLDCELQERLQSWLSYHLSNFNYQWPWDRWAWVAERPVDDPQRLFCVELLQRLVRLSYWEQVHACLPPSFQELLGPKPQVLLMPLQQQQQQQHQQAHIQPQNQPRGNNVGDHDMLDVEQDQQGGQPDNETAAAMEKEDAAAVSTGSQGEGEGADAAKLMEWVRAQAKVLPERQRQRLVLPETTAAQCSNELMAWLQEHLAASAELRLRVVGRALLAIGDKSPSHMHICLERYAPAIKSLVSQIDQAVMASDTGTGPVSTGQLELLQLVGEFYSEHPQKLKLAVDRMLYLRVLACPTAARWVITSSCTALRPYGADGPPSMLLWELLVFLMDRSIGASDELPEEIDTLQERLAATQRHLASVQAQMADHAPSSGALTFLPDRAADLQSKAAHISQTLQLARDELARASGAVVHTLSEVVDAFSTNVPNQDEDAMAEDADFFKRDERMLQSFLRHSASEATSRLPMLRDVFSKCPPKALQDTLMQVYLAL